MTRSILDSVHKCIKLESFRQHRMCLARLRHYYRVYSLATMAWLKTTPRQRRTAGIVFTVVLLNSYILVLHWYLPLLLFSTKKTLPAREISP